MSTPEIAELHVDVAGRPVRVLERGEGPEAVVLLHGGLAGHAPWEGSADLWRPVMERLDAPRVIAVDLPGAGGTPAEDVEDLTIAGLTARVAATLEALGGTGAVPVGHGEASLIALLLGREAPAGINVAGVGVVAGDGAAPTSDGVPPVVLLNAPARQDATAQARWALDRLSWSGAAVTPELVAAMAARAEGLGRRSAAAALAAPGARERLDGDLLGAKMELFAFARDHGYATRISILWAAEDPLLTVEHGDALFALLATTRAHLSFTVVPRAGHLVMLEEPAATVRTLAPLAWRSFALAGAGR